VERILGEGGMGVVYRCIHTIIGKKVAMKVLRADLARDKEVTERFLNEARSASAIGNAHIIDISDFGLLPDGSTYFVMEFLEGDPLTKIVEGGTPVPIERLVNIARQLAEGLAAAHAAGIVHRDLKPDNIFLVRNEDDEIAKVLDFGIAKRTSAAFDVTTGTRTGAMMGTPYYMSPEQVEGSKTIDHRADLWALGVITFECVTGTRPFDDETLGALLLKICMKPIPVPSQIAQVPSGFDAWFARASRRAPEERFQSAREMMEALRVILTPGASGHANLPTPTADALESARAAIAIHASGDADLQSGERNAAPIQMAVERQSAMSEGHPAGVPRKNRMLPMLIGLCLLALVAAAVLLLGGPGDGASPKAGAPIRQVVDAPTVAAPTTERIAAPAHSVRLAVTPEHPAADPTSVPQPAARKHASVPVARPVPAANPPKPALAPPFAKRIAPPADTQPPVLRVSPAPAARPKQRPARTETEFGF
jgi:tRNA A-37 threonylcarbamoyl transferase component Bud32